MNSRVLILLVAAATITVHSVPIKDLSNDLSVTTRGLQQDLEDFLALVPVDKIQDVVLEYVAMDEDFQSTLDYLLSNDFKSLVLEIEAFPELKDLIKYLHESGLDVYTILDKVHDFLGLEHYVPSAKALFTARISGGLPGLIVDVKALLPVEAIEALYKKKLETSPEFAVLIKRLGSPEFQKVVDSLWANEKFQELINRAKAKGVDVKEILDLITEIIGIKFPGSKMTFELRGLPEDLEDFLTLVPVDKIQDVVLEYVAMDEDFQSTLDYLLSNDFKSLVLEIEAFPELKTLIKYLHESGLDVYTILDKVHDFLGLEHYVPSAKALFTARISGGLPGLIVDVKALLPVEAIEALYKKKLETSPEFAALIKRLGSPEFQKVVDTLWANEKFQELINRAKAKGVDVKEILDLITEIIGIKFPGSGYNIDCKSSLKHDLNDFLKLVPKLELFNLFLEYFNNDQDFRDASEYFLMSKDFPNLVLEVEGTEGVSEFFEYLHDVGLDVYNFINGVHRFLGLDPYYPTMSLRSSRITGGLSGLLEDIKKILPIDKIKALYEEKQRNSRAFQDFLDYLRSQEFQRTTDRIMQNKGFQDLIDRAESKGLDVQGIIKDIEKLLGIESSKKIMTVSMANDELMKDLKDIAKLVPVKKIKLIVLSYAVRDNDFKRVVNYMLSRKFHKLIENVESTIEMKEFLEYLNEIGLDVYKWISVFHKIINMDDSSDSIQVRVTGGINGLIEDIRAVLPIEALNALYEDKLANSSAFAEFVERLRSKELQNLVNALAKNSEVQRILNTLESMNVDVDEIFKLLSDFFGIIFPPRPPVYHF